MTDGKHRESAARKEKALETATAILLGVTTLLTAWATWVGSLYAGHEHIHFTESNNTATSAIALYNDATQLVLRDVTTWNSIQGYNLDAQVAAEDEDDSKLKVAKMKIKALEENCSPEFEAAMDWALETGKSPFEKEGLAESYYSDARSLVEKSQDILEAGKQDNTNSHRFGLVTVIYSLVLFLLGIAGTFKSPRNRKLTMGTAVALLAVGFVFMLSIPLPEGFDLFHFLAVN